MSYIAHWEMSIGQDAWGRLDIAREEVIPQDIARVGTMLIKIPILTETSDKSVYGSLCHNIIKQKKACSFLTSLPVDFQAFNFDVPFVGYFTKGRPGVKLSR